MSIIKEMNSRNLNYCYYVEYYNGVVFNNLECEDTQGNLQSHNQQLCNYAAQQDDLMTPLGKDLAPQSIELQTVYPGLLIGTGLAHGFGGKGEAALGLSLDYVTGMPYIPGSSVKGTLRSAFEHKDYIRKILEGNGFANADDEFIKNLEAGIFGKPIKDDDCNANPKDEDIFFDAIVTSTGRLLATDAITPHRMDSELLELANPNPLTLIRIRPGVKFKFQFSLKPRTLGVSAEIKLKLFTQILLDMGIGAKTNVGYGQLEVPTERNARTNTNADTGRSTGANAGTAGSGSNRDYVTTPSQTASIVGMRTQTKLFCPHCKKKTTVEYTTGDKAGKCRTCKKQVPIS